jgi:large subunit ribosomal protein L18
VFRSHKHIYAQIVDDRAGRTLAAASTLEPELGAAIAKKTKREQAAMVGETVAGRAKEKGIQAVVFDRGGYDYHGRVRELAEAARKAGLAF